MYFVWKAYGLFFQLQIHTPTKPTFKLHQYPGRDSNLQSQGRGSTTQYHQMLGYKPTSLLLNTYDVFSNTEGKEKKRNEIGRKEMKRKERKEK